MPKTPPKVKSQSSQAEFVGCAVKKLPDESSIEAAELAVSENPLNRPPEWAVRRVVSDDATDLPQRIAALTSKYWGNKGVKLGVYFFGNPAAALRTKILDYMNRWRTANPKGSNVTLVESTLGMSQVRVSFDTTGYWSYLGTDILANFLAGQPTMNLQGFDRPGVPESEYARVVTHETGHTLGCPHEHMRAEIINKLDRTRTIQYFMQTQGWSQQDVIQQVLTPMAESALLAATPPDPTSVMCYRLPGSITKDGVAIAGGNDINQQDYEYITKIYPPTVVVVPPQPPTGPPTGDKVRISFDYDEKTNAVNNVVVVTAAQSTPTAEGGQG